MTTQVTTCVIADGAVTMSKLPATGTPGAGTGGVAGTANSSNGTGGVGGAVYVEWNK